MMKKILIWGMGLRCAMWHRWIMEHFEVKAFIDHAMDIPSTVKGVPVIQKEDIGGIERDIIVIATDHEMEMDIRKDAEAIGLSENELINIEQLIRDEHLQGNYEEEIVSKQIKILKDILNASDSEVCDFNWMYRKVLEYGIFCFESRWYEASDNIEWNVYGLQQIPEEFADFCISIAPLRVQTAIEIGVYRGRSSYFISAILMRKNPRLRYLLVDIVDRLEFFTVFQSLLPCLEKDIPSTSETYKGQTFDFVFIDADHSYDASIRDFKNVGQYANMITCFHDIYAHEYDQENGGTVRMWKEVMQQTRGKRHHIYSKYPDQWMGIGCVLNQTDPYI